MDLRILPMMPFGEAQNKVTRAYTQSGLYHTIVKNVQYIYILSKEIVRIYFYC